MVKLTIVDNIRSDFVQLVLTIIGSESEHEFLFFCPFRSVMINKSATTKSTTYISITETLKLYYTVWVVFSFFRFFVYFVTLICQPVTLTQNVEVYRT